MKKRTVVIVVVIVLVLAIILAYYKLTGSAIIGVKDCVDSDNGDNKYIQGTATNENGKESIDYCTSVIKLKEYYCKNSVIYAKRYFCEIGCKDGACLK